MKFDLKSLKQSWEQLLAHWESRNRPPGWVGLSFSDEGLAISYVLPGGSDKTRLQVCEFISCPAMDLDKALAELVHFYQLKGAACSWILNRTDYHLLFIDMPLVPKEELQSAIKWLVKDLIDFPIREAVLDYFTTPETVIHDPRKIFVAVTQKSKLEEKAAAINASGLNLVAVDINVLALRNLGMLLAKVQEDIALLHLEQSSCSMVILSELALCLARQINVSLASFDQMGITPNIMETHLLVEIESTLDYFTTQMTRPIPDKIFLLPLTGRYAQINHYLCEKLPQRMQEVNFNPILDIPKHIDQGKLAQCAMAICGALRQEVGHETEY